MTQPTLTRIERGTRSVYDFEVVALSLDRGGRNVVEPFLDKLGVRNLAMYLDPQSTAMSAFKPRGLPTTMLIDREGYEVGRLEGDAEWNSEEAVKLLEHFIDNGVRPPAMMKTSVLIRMYEQIPAMRPYAIE